MMNEVHYSYCLNYFPDRMTKYMASLHFASETVSFRNGCSAQTTVNNYPVKNEGYLFSCMLSCFFPLGKLFSLFTKQ